jgi:hypothetical protein
MALASRLSTLSSRPKRSGVEGPASYAHSHRFVEVATKLSSDFCSRFTAGAASSCASFKDLFDDRDKELLSAMGTKRGDSTVICFDEGEDRFIELSMSISVSGKSSLAYDEYRKGRRESNHRSTELKWYAPLGEQDHTYPEGWWMPPDDNLHRRYDGDHISTLETVATVDDSEISAKYSFPNRHDTITDYELTIRRSTKRFIESYQVGKGSPIEQTGHCALFE